MVAKRTVQRRIKPGRARRCTCEAQRFVTHTLYEDGVVVGERCDWCAVRFLHGR